ncbi:MAG: hypothetical protein Q8O37_11300 [Sulfuricellaceae bacterium]|nr:hypothetical protein [Sulfuricellaceae bacterium]
MSNLDIALSGATYLAQLVDKDGRFKYRFDPVSGSVAEGYNVLRHCGAVWAMLEVSGHSDQKKDIVASGTRAVTYLLNQFMKFSPDYRYACIAEDNSIKLGGNALAILAMLSVYRATGDGILKTLAESLGKYILKDWKADGDFVHKRYLKSGKVSDFKSMYYTGEALLALLHLFEASGDERWLEAVIRSEDALAPSDYGAAEQSHWMLYALELLCQYRWNENYARHAGKIVRHILDFPEYRSWGRSTPTACRSEGLLAFVRLLDQGKCSQELAGLRIACLEAIDLNLGEQLRFQLDTGAFIRGGDDHRKNEVRIDYIQHNISALLYRHQLEKL